MTGPKVSIIMPVHNGEKFLEESIKSALNQTYSNFELIIVNDGSTDRSSEVAQLIKDHRIKLIEVSHNHGAAAARNTGLKHSLGEYIALLDSDDLAHPDRLETQVNFLEKNGYNMTGSWAQPFNGSNNNAWIYPINPEILKARMLFDCPFTTSTVVIRKSFLVQYHLSFDSSLRFAEDYDLWERISGITSIHNVPKILVDYRFHQNQSTSGLNSSNQVLAASKIIQKRQLQLLGINPTPHEMEIHAKIGLGWCTDLGLVSPDAIINWLNKILNGNNFFNVLDQKALEFVVLERWFIACLHFNSNLTYWKRISLFPGIWSTFNISKWKRLKLYTKSLLLSKRLI